MLVGRSCEFPDHVAVVAVSGDRRLPCSRCLLRDSTRSDSGNAGRTADGPLRMTHVLHCTVMQIALMMQP
jgi:hypothetical protein